MRIPLLRGIWGVWCLLILDAFLRHLLQHLVNDALVLFSVDQVLVGFDLALYGLLKLALLGHTRLHGEVDGFAEDLQAAAQVGILQFRVDLETAQMVNCIPKRPSIFAPLFFIFFLFK